MRYIPGAVPMGTINEPVVVPVETKELELYISSLVSNEILLFQSTQIRIPAVPPTKEIE